MVRLKSYVNGAWFEGQAPFATLIDPATEAPVAEASTRGLDFAAAVKHAREVGGPALRALTFAQRAALIKEASRAIYAERERLLDIAQVNGGNTRGDAKFDVDGATATLSYYASVGKGLGDVHHLIDGDTEVLSRTNARFVGLHVRAPKRGVAVHVNAFNFPAWGTFEKAAVAWLAGMPVITKPATSTAWLTYEMVKILIDGKILPEGALQLIAGSAGDLLDQLGGQDVLAFTGSANTGATLRGSNCHTQRSVAVNVEADSLNAAVLGPDVERGDDVYNWFVRAVQVEMTQKAGQKCTAIRRVIVPEPLVDAVIEDLSDALSRVVVGNPADATVTMGPLTTLSQLNDYRAGVALLSQDAEIVFGSAAPVNGVGAPEGKGAYAAPVVLRARDSLNAPNVHQHEVFGPVCTVLPYDGTAAQAAQIVALGEGSLATSVATDDRDFLAALLLELTPYNGRVLTVDKKVADQATPHGMVLPQLNHGGPGRAGGGEELGGLRGLDLYLQRTAIQGNRGVLERLLNVPKATG
ncbi:MAG: 3,4-dehydroadipyl-CoA semialdehyde dehydrogenase [Deltaproteobacteria bacterium]|nr:3,4-dehydroadipyl-CoA semialdehyde dehydrogenase [Deltaproteobacteria bacterium]